MCRYLMLAFVCHDSVHKISRLYKNPWWTAVNYAMCHNSSLMLPSQAEKRRLAGMLGLWLSNCSAVFEHFPWSDTFCQVYSRSVPQVLRCIPLNVSQEASCPRNGAKPIAAGWSQQHGGSAWSMISMILWYLASIDCIWFLFILPPFCRTSEKSQLQHQLWWPAPFHPWHIGGSKWSITSDNIISRLGPQESFSTFLGFKKQFGGTHLGGQIFTPLEAIGGHRTQSHKAKEPNVPVVQVLQQRHSGIWHPVPIHTWGRWQQDTSAQNWRPIHRQHNMLYLLCMRWCSLEKPSVIPSTARHFLQPAQALKAALKPSARLAVSRRFNHRWGMVGVWDMVCAEATSPQSQDGAHTALRACVSWKRLGGLRCELNQWLSVYHMLASIGRTIFSMVSYVLIKPTPPLQTAFSALRVAHDGGPKAWLLHQLVEQMCRELP